MKLLGWWYEQHSRVELVPVEEPARTLRCDGHAMAGGMACSKNLSGEPAKADIAAVLADPVGIGKRGRSECGQRRNGSTTDLVPKPKRGAWPNGQKKSATRPRPLVSGWAAKTRRAVEPQNAPSRGGSVPGRRSPGAARTDGCGSGFAEQIDRHRRLSLAECRLTKWSSAASVASPLQRRVRRPCARRVCAVSSVGHDVR